MRMTRGFAALHPGLTDPTLSGLSSYTSIICHTQNFINSPSPIGMANQIAAVIIQQSFKSDPKLAELEFKEIA